MRTWGLGFMARDYSGCFVGGHGPSVGLVKPASPLVVMPADAGIQ
jgi:hypothetical protein